MNKRIDEMTKDLCRVDTCEIKKIGIPCNHRCKAHIYATRAIDKGYRRASDVAREIFKEIERVLAMHFGTYTDNDTVMVRDLFMLLNKFAEEEMEGEG